MHANYFGGSWRWDVKNKRKEDDDDEHKKKWLMKSAVLCRIIYVWYWSEVLYSCIWLLFYFFHFHYSLILYISIEIRNLFAACWNNSDGLCTHQSILNIYVVCVYTKNSLKGFFLLFIIILFFILHILHQNPTYIYTFNITIQKKIIYITKPQTIFFK